MKIGGCEVVDAKTPLAIEVTRWDSMRGRRGDPTRCAAAVALKREHKNIDEAVVQVTKTYVKKGNVWIRYRTPSRLRLEIVSFDRGGSARHSEGIYDLLPPSESERLGQNKYYQKYAKMAGLKKKRRRIAQRTIEGVRPMHAVRKWKS